MRLAVPATSAVLAVVLCSAGPAAADEAQSHGGSGDGSSCVGTVMSQTAASGPRAVADEVRFVRETLPLAFPGFENRGQAVRLLAQVDGGSEGECRRAWFRRLLDGPGR